jgi:hypothetical protein
MSYNKQSVLNNTAAANNTVVVTVPASSDVPRYVRAVRAVFDNTSGNVSATLTISSGGSEIVNTYAALDGADHIDFGVPGLAGAAGSTVVVTLGALSGKIGRLSVFVDES